MKFLSFVLIMLLCTTAMAQHVGIGTTNPQTKLHIAGTDSSLLTLDYNNALASNTKNILYFKTGAFYTGAVATIGTGVNVARMGFYTFATSTPEQLRERMSITDNGNVGIGIVNPGYKLDVVGDINLSGRLFSNGNAGTAGQALFSSGAGSPLWANAAGQYGFRTGSSANQTVPNATDQQLDFEAPSSGLSFENGEVFAETTNEFTAPVTGIYLIAASAGINTSTAGRVRIAIKNANSSGFYAANSFWYTPSSLLTANCFAITEIPAGTKLVVVLQNQTGNTVTVYNGVDTYFSAVLIK